ncbi:MAG: hypothetical protein GTO55_08515 [Armatimonadetes bacterium]|nr:hypothetical protein [Armatimonadota bacterium]NIM24288.1 hypothetical protein [Armatimonadota bacterium]NIM68157.1 hypothetical protein [Armatimonadota bacterium]NIM76617.1 hypothetical protein [Armatimonadota bacterium]NIN06362.1 hypothetical protein [Armatimonadota bacterium]
MKKTKKDTAASKKVAAAKSRKRTPVKRSPKVLAPGEEIRLSLRTHNQFTGYDPRLLREEGPSRPIEGIILSIREIASGQLVPLASSDFGRYVLEVLHNRSFDPSCASAENAPSGATGDRPQAAPLWEKVRSTLRAMTKERRLVSLTDGSLSSSPLATMLDGWRIVKVRADQIEVPE